MIEKSQLEMIWWAGVAQFDWVLGVDSSPFGPNVDWTKMLPAGQNAPISTTLKLDFVSVY